MAWFIRVESREDFVQFMCWERLLVTDAASYGPKSITAFKARKSSFLRMCWQDAVVGKLIQGSAFQHLLGPYLIANLLKVLTERLFY